MSCKITKKWKINKILIKLYPTHLFSSKRPEVDSVFCFCPGAFPGSGHAKWFAQHKSRVNLSSADSFVIRTFFWKLRISNSWKKNMFWTFESGRFEAVLVNPFRYSWKVKIFKGQCGAILKADLRTCHFEHVL